MSNHNPQWCNSQDNQTKSEDLARLITKVKLFNHLSWRASKIRWLVENQGHGVEFPAGVFHLLPDQVLVATIEEILNGLIGTSPME